MNSTDITPLIRIGLAVIGLAMATGHYKELRAFAVKEAIRSSRGWHTPAFFPEVRLDGSRHHTASQRASRPSR